MNRVSGFIRTAGLIAVTALIYYMLTLIGIYFKLPYDQGTLIWPAAGFAFVMVLMFGYRIIPGIFFGTLISGFEYIFGLSLTFGEILQSISDNRMPFFLGIGASLQSGIGVWLVKSRGLYPQGFNSPLKIAQFYFYSAAVGALISSFVGNLAFGFAANMDFVFGVLVWWVGDAVSVCVFASVIFAFTKFSLRRRIVITSFVFVIFSIVMTTYYLTLAWDRDRLDFLLSEKVNALTNELDDQFNEYNALMVSMQGLVKTQLTLTKDEFQIFTEQFLPLNPTVQAVNISEIVKKEELEEFTATLRSEHFDDLKLVKRNGSPLTDQDSYTIVRFSEPYDKFANIVGRDMSSSFATDVAMEYAVKNNTGALTRPLKSPINPELTIVAMYYPIQKDGALSGFSALVIELNNVMNLSILTQDYVDGLDFRIIDNGEDSDFSTLYQHGANDSFNNIERTVSIPLFNRTWDIQVSRNEEFYTHNMSNQPMYVGLVGVFILGFATIWIVYMTGQRSYLEELVANRTEALNKANQAKSAFMANMSHDLRTPLNAIIGFSELMRRELFGSMKNDRYAAYVKDIHHSSSYLLSLINEILDFSTIEAGKKKLTLEDFMIRPVIEECMRTLKPLSDKKKIEPVLNMENADLSIFADETAFRQIIINIVSNSIKFTPEGGDISISVKDINVSHVISINDTGQGIAKDNIKVILEPFGRALTNPHHTQEGTGLGLSIVQGLMQLHNGHIEIDSEIGVGTTVELHFPKVSDL